MKKIITDKLVELISEAFLDVRLGRGIGLFEGKAIDMYESDVVRASNKARDEKLNWSAIKPVDLNLCYSSLSYFDAEGMRFHLPAFLVADLNEVFIHDVLFTLTSDHCFYDGKFNLLTAMQKHAVRQYLLFMQQKEYELGNKNGNSTIEEALKNKWPEWFFFTLAAHEND